MCVCVSVSVDSYGGRQCAHKAVEKEHVPAPGTSSKATRWGTEREKDMKVRQEDRDE